MKILLANPRGFCAGVDRAIEIVERAVELFGAPIHVRHEVVHNRHVVESLRAKGAVFIEELAEVPAGSTVIFSAHGVSRAVRADAEARGKAVARRCFWSCASFQFNHLHLDPKFYTFFSNCKTSYVVFSKNNADLES